SRSAATRIDRSPRRRRAGHAEDADRVGGASARLLVLGPRAVGGAIARSNFPRAPRAGVAHRRPERPWARSLTLGVPSRLSVSTPSVASGPGARSLTLGVPSRLCQYPERRERT